MRRHKVPLSSLSVGRCFTLPREPMSPEGTTEERPQGATLATPVLSASEAWKVTDMAEQEASVTSASGESRCFPLATEVVEIPRQGYETLAAR